ncbi:MAG: transcriptional repressor [Deltaproteobacteria bacterium]|nr:transcriptional repressor [Deltaproteobacteria bacterium]
MTTGQNHCDPLESLEKAGLQKTIQRIVVLRAVIRADRPITAAEIYEDLDVAERVNKVTVYRVLASLEEAGIVRGIPTVDGMNYYEMACSHNPLHAHFYCRYCRAMTCLGPLGEEICQNLYPSCRHEADALSVSITGLCNDCRRNKTKRKEEPL